MDRRSQSQVLFVSVVLLAVLALGFVFAGSTTAQTADITVDAGGSTNYTSIQAAVDNANDSERIEVQPGVYNESVQIDKNVTLVAPDGATISNTSTESSRAGIQIVGLSTKPEIAGFTITGWQWGIRATSTGAWTVDNMTITDVKDGINAYESSSAWTVTDVVITNSTQDALSVEHSTGDWTVQNTTISDSEDGIEAENTSGAWHVQNTTISDSENGIDAENASGAWHVLNTTIQNSTNDPIDANRITGAATIQETVINQSEDDGIKIERTSGEWTIISTTISDIADDGIDGYLSQGGTIQNTTIETVGTNGINIYDTGGDWIIENTTVQTVGATGINNGDGNESSSVTVHNVTVQDTEIHGLNFYNSSTDWTVERATLDNINQTAIEAGSTEGSWKVTASTLTDGTGDAVSASDGATMGNASYNYWGASDGPSGDFDGSGGAAVGNLIVAPYYTDADLTTAETTINENTGFVDVDVTALPGSGTETDPYIIGNASELQAIEDDLSAHYELGASIDASDTSAWNGGSGFSPIGTDENSQFTGRFDGEGNAITGLSIDRSTTDNVGLFGYIGSDGLVRDVVLEDVEIRGGNFSVGGLAGVNNGTVTDAVASGSVNATEEVGGLVGRNTGTITESSATTTVDGTLNIGGIVGRNEGSISTTSANSSIDGLRNVGGLVGNNLNATITQSTADSYTNGSEHVGGLVGLNNDATIRNASAKGTVNGSERVGGLVGLNNGAQINETFATADVTGSTAVGGLVGDASDDTVTGSYWDEGATNRGSSVGGTGLSTSQMIGDAAPTNMTALDFVETWETEANDYPALARLSTDSDISFAEPVVNETASSVSPGTVATNETKEYTVDVTIDNTSLTDESGQVDVDFENFSLENSEEELQINYTENDITDGTLEVSGSVNATAPAIAGRYAVNLKEIWVDGSGEGPVEDASMTIDTIEVGDVADPIVNETASSVTPTTVTADENETYTVDIVIDNTSLSDAEGDVNVEFGKFSLDIDDDSLDGPEEDLKINYTSTDLTDGTLNVSATVSGQAPSTAGIYPINVTDLEVYGISGDELLIEDANETIDTINVTDDTSSDGGGTGESTATPVLNESRSSIVPTETPANDTEPYDIDVVIDNTSLTNESGEVDVSFESFDLGTGEDLTIDYTGSNITNGTLSVSAETTATAPATPGVYNASLSALRVTETNETLIEDANRTISEIEVTEPADPVINETESSVTPSTVTANETEAYTVNVTIDNTTLTNESGVVDVGFENFNLENSVEELRINYTENDITEGTLEVSGSVNATAPATAGTYAVNLREIWVDGDAEGPVEDANMTVDTIEVGEAANPVINETTSSVSPATTTADETEEYTVNVTVENTTLTEESGVVDISFEEFLLEAPEDELRINYTASDISDGTLSVAASVNATAPATAGTYEVNLREIWVDGPSEGPVEDANMTIDRIEVGEAADPVVNTTASSVTPTDVTETEFEEFSVDVVIDNTTLTDESGEVDVDFENFSLDTGEDDLTIAYTDSDISNGTLTVSESVNATAPNTTGEYEVDVTDLRRGTDEYLIEDANAEIGRITVGERPEPVVDEAASAIAPTNATANDTVTYDVEVVIDNTSLTDESGEVDVSFDGFDLDADGDQTNDTDAEDLTIDYTVENITDGTLTVSTSVNATAPNTAGAYAINVTDLRREEAGDSVEYLIEDADRTIETITVSVPSLTVDRTAVDFGEVSTVNSSVAQVNVTNNGSIPITVDAATLAGSDADQFVINESAITGEIPAETIRTVEIAFEPDSEGNSTANLTLSAAEPDRSPRNISLTGTATATNLSLTPNTTSIVAGDPIRFTVTDESGTAVTNATVELADTDIKTGPDGNASARIETSGTYTATATKGSSAYASDSVTINVAEPTLMVNETSLEFGTTELETITQDTITLVNDNATAVEVGAAELSGPNASQFSVVESTVPESVGANSNRTVSVRYEPTVRDSVTASLDIAGETVSLSGTGSAPQINVTGLPIELTAKEDDSANATLQISNDGNAPLNATLSTDDSAFSHPSEVDVEDGTTSSVDIRFDANADATTELEIGADSPAVSNVTLTVTGTVEERSVDLRQSEIDFGAVTVGSPVTSTVVVDNTGTTTEELSVTTTNSTLFDLADASDESITLDEGDSERLTVEATLTESGIATETLRVRNDSAQTIVNTTATLNATGEKPRLNVTSDEPVGFDNTSVGSTSTAEVEIDNDGTAPLVADLNTTDTANFSVVGETTVEVPADDSRTVTVRFTPQTAGDATANLTLDTNDVDATADTENVTLEATGSETDLRISESVSTFDTTGVGGSATQTLEIENNGSTELILSGDTTGDFNVDAPSDIASGSSANVSVTFEPTTNGTRTGSLTITGTDPATENETSVSTSLAGTGQYGKLRINQDTLRTGVTTADGTTTGSVTVENVGPDGAQLSVAVDDISIADSGNFSHSETGLTTGGLGSGENATLAVTFDPENADNGEQSTTLTLTATSPDGVKTISQTLDVTGIVSAPDPTVSPDQLSVGTVTVGEQVVRTVTVSNDGGEPFEITGNNTGDDVTADRIGPSEIVPGGESTVVIVANPTSTGSFDSDVTINTDDDTDLNVSVTGRAVAPELNVTTETVAFGDTPVGSANQSTVTIRNDGNATLAAEPTIENDAFRLLSGDRELRIAPGSSQTVSVGFAPSTQATVEANLEVDPLNEPDGKTQTVSLSGTGTNATAKLSESAVSFGDVRPDRTVSRTLSINNTGNAELEVTGSSVLDSDAFSVSGLGTPTIAGGGSRTFDLELNTTELDRGSLDGQIVIRTDSGSRVTSYLGATVVAPDIETPEPVDADEFGTTRLGTTSTAEVSINNTGNTELNLTELSVTGTDAAAFEIVETPDNTTVPAQDSGRLVVEFDPSALDNAASRAQNTPLDADDATLNVSSDDPNDQFVEIDLDGEAVTPRLSVPRTFQFGDVGLEETSTGNLTVKNAPSATAPLNITGLELAGADAGDYTASSSGDGTLAPGESATVEVSLTPTSSLDQKYATLSVETDDTRQPVRKVGLSNTETVYSVTYGSVNVQYINPTDGTEPTVDVDRGFRGRNATLRSVNSNVSTTEDYTLNYTFGSEPTAVGHDEALNDSDAGGNVTAVQYINATTSADDGNFTESTFQTEVSKATLARGNVNPGNVTIYHEDGNSYDALDTELLYETTRGYVYEVTTDSYSVFAVAHPETTEQTTDGPDDDPDDNPDDNPDDSPDDGSTGGGGGGASDEEETTPIADIVQDVADLTPETESESEITDADPDRAGVTVEPTDTKTVSAVTFADESVSGTVSVKEYQPDADLTTQIESSVNGDLDAAASATDGSTNSDSDGGDDSTTSNVRLVSVTDISPSSSQATESAATVELTVDREALDDPNNAFVVHETDDGWEQLETTVEETEDGTVSLSAETDSFSLFAVVESQPNSEASDQGTETAEETDDGDDDTEGGSSTLLLVVGLLAAVAVLGAVLAVVRRE